MISAQFRAEVRERAQNACEYCHLHQDDSPLAALHVEHIIPRIHGGSDDIANLAFIGGKTNRAISDKPPADYFPALIAKAGVDAFAAQCIPTGDELLSVQHVGHWCPCRVAW